MKKPALKSLSDKELLAQIQRLRRREHLSTIEILLHLNEVERRRLDLKLGYNLENIQNKSQGEIDAIASRYRRPVALRDRVKPVRVVVPEPKIAPVHAGHGKAQQSAARGACESNHDSHNGSSLTLTDVTATGNGGGCGAPVRTEQKLFIQFLANKAFMRKYEEVRALLSQRLSNTSFENVFEALIDEFLEHHCPVRRKARRDKKTIARRPASVTPRDFGKTTPARANSWHNRKHARGRNPGPSWLDG